MIIDVDRDINAEGEVIRRVLYNPDSWFPYECNTPIYTSNTNRISNKEIIKDLACEVVTDLQQIKDNEILKQKKEEIAECIDSCNIPSCLYCGEFEHCLLQIDYTRTVASLVRD